MKDALTKIIKSIVTDEKAVKIEEETIDTSVNYTISVGTEDVGKVIGKEGKIIRAIRNVMKIPAMKQGKRITINIVG